MGKIATPQFYGCAIRVYTDTGMSVSINSSRGVVSFLTSLSILAGLGCAKRSTQVFLPTQEEGIDSGSGITIRLDARPSQNEAGTMYDGALGCTNTPELCNGIDDDCDGVIDNGFDLQVDPLNCGGCGILCTAPAASTVCASGLCAIASCTPGYADADKQTGNGCECMVTNSGVELCDGADNDCDGVIDNGFDLQSDVKNCGKCGVVCSAASADSSCQAGACAFACKAGHYDANKKPSDGCEYVCTPTADPTEICDGLDNDCNGQIDGEDLGLSYTPADRTCYSSAAGSCQTGLTTCVAAKLVCVGAGPPSEEVCDGRDNNCNGTVDEADPNLGKTCYAPGASGCDAGGTCKGECKRGAYTCTKAALVCGGMVIPQVEICDGKDNDCDGVVDNGFDTDTDPRNCGGCGHACSFAHGIPLCVSGVCAFDPKSGQGACADGWVDANHNPADGCEYACIMDGVEVCDGKDNDCNGLVDAADPGLVYPANFCLQAGECAKGPGGSTHSGWESAASYPVCTTPAGAAAGAAPSWICNYPATVQVSATGALAVETWCDGKDNDCNGVIDDPHAKQLGSACSDPGSTALGACLRKGIWRCQADNTAACDFTGAPPAALPSDETCDGVDNDCDGLVDESWDNPAGFGQCNGHDCLGVRDATVHVNAAGAPGGGYYIYTYESSRVDATASAQGTSTMRACSRAQSTSGAGVVPWSNVSWSEAATACAKAGMRLCRVARAGGVIQSDEWGFACQGGQTCTAGYPYGCTYGAATCNTSDSNLGRAVPCGSLASCASAGDLDTSATGEHIYDLSGNLAEWTDDRRDNAQTPAGSPTSIYTTRGGAFDSFYRGAACDFTGTELYATFSYADTGFRCCSSCAPGRADCAGTCVNLASDAANCGACGVACAAGTSCQNGGCK